MCDPGANAVTVGVVSDRQTELTGICATVTPIATIEMLLL